MNCPKCNDQMIAEVDIHGGCSGHSEGEYCYCDSPNISVSFVCPNRSKEIYEYGKFKKNKKYCNQKAIKISDLSCKESVARYLTKNYKPSEETILF